MPDVTIERRLPIFGYNDQHGHCEIAFRDVRVPATNLLGKEGDGFLISQARAIGMAECALALMVQRTKTRVAFRHHLSDYAMCTTPPGRSTSTASRVPGARSRRSRSPLLL